MRLVRTPGDLVRLGKTCLELRHTIRHIIRHSMRRFAETCEETIRNTEGGLVRLVWTSGDFVKLVWTSDIL